MVVGSAAGSDRDVLAPGAGRHVEAGPSRALVGRDEELAWALSRVRPGCGVVIAGESGIGKTRLAEAIADRSRANGAAVVRLVGTASLQSVPLGVLAWLLPSAPTSDATAEPSSASGDAERSLEHLSAACEALAARAADDQLVLVLDDAHWLDDAMLAVAWQLVLAGEIALVATVRSGEPAPELLTSLWKDEVCERLDLQPLSASQVAELASVRLGGRFDAATLDRLTEVTAGNPLYLRELLGELIRAGALRRHGDAWTWDGQLVVGERLAELLDRRIGGLSDAATELAVLVALGEPLPAAVMGQLAGAAVIREAHQQGVLVTERGPGSTVRLRHPLLGAALLDRYPDTGPRLRRLAEAMTAMSDPSDADIVRGARWGLEAGAPDADQLARAARLTAVVDHGGANRLAAAAVDADDTIARRLLQVETLVTALRYDSALECLDVIDRLLAALDPHRLGDGGAVRLGATTIDQARVTADLWRISCLGWGRRDFAAVRAVVDRWPDGHPAKPMLEAHWTAVLAFHGDQSGAARARELIHHPDRAVSFRALSAADLADCLAGRAETCIARAERLLADVIEAGGPSRKARWVLAPLLRGLYLAGRLEEFGSYLDVAVGQVTSRAVPSGYLAIPQGVHALTQGRAAAAVSHLEHAVQQGHAGELEPWWHRFATAALGEAYALAGRVREAAAVAAESDEIGATLGLLGPRPEDLDSRRSLVWVETAVHGRYAGRAAAEAEADRCAEVGAPMFELLVRHDAVRLGSPAERHADRIAALGAGIEGRWPAPITAQTLGIAAQDPTRLEEAAEEFAAMGAWMLGAEAAARAAAVHEARGNAAGRRRLEARAGALSARCDGIASPVMGSPPGLLGLTEREREVAELAAAGRSSRAIADELFLSVRTVDNHLGRIYAKLGIRRRTELPDRLRAAR